MKVERITVIGMGYVGLALALGLASKKYKVICVDSDEKKIKMLTNDQNYIYEEGFDECLKENKDFLDFCTKIPHDKKPDLYFVCVNTPSLNNGACDISRVKDVIDKILIFDKETPIIIKSTCEVGTSRKFQKYIYDKKAYNPIVFNPEFLAQGTAYENMIHPDRVVIGGEKKEVLNTLNNVLNVFSANVIMTSWESAETIKYASNALLATKVAAINEIANLCDKTGANIKEVSKGVGLDHRIGSSFLEAGCGFGGSCFEKDIKALLSLANKHNVDMNIFSSVLRSNARQRLIVVEKLKNEIKDLSKISVAVLGLSFKEDTNDARESVALYVVNELMKEGATVKLYDPEAKMSFVNEYKMKFGELLEDKFFYNNIEDALIGVDACIVLTKWKQIIDLTDQAFDKFNPNMIIVDGRNCLNMCKKSIKIGVKDDV